MKDLIEFMSDDNKIREERRKAKKNQNRYQGIGHSGGGDDFGHSSYDDAYRRGGHGYDECVRLCTSIACIFVYIGTFVCVYSTVSPIL